MPSTHRTPPAQAPTPAQQRLLRALALERGVSFTPPRTKAQASAEIRRLKQRRPDSRRDRARDTKAVRDAIHSQAGDAARVRDHELAGHGSTATWNSKIDDEPTQRQVEYIMRLGRERGTTFAVPANRTEATILIEDLMASKATWKDGRS